MDNKQEKEILANSIVKAIAYAENGGKPNINNPVAGKSGEMKSIFQFEPDTWKTDAKQFLGNENTPLTADNETYVMQQKVLKWIDEGKDVNQMASMHNSGNPNAYKANHKGVNKYGVAYDTPAYSKKVADYARQFYKEKTSKPDPVEQENTSMIQTPMPKTELSGKLGGLFQGNAKPKVNKGFLPSNTTSQ